MPTLHERIGGIVDLHLQSLHLRDGVLGIEEDDLQRLHVGRRRGSYLIMAEDVSIALRGQQEERKIQSWGEWRNRCYQRLPRQEHGS